MRFRTWAPAMPAIVAFALAGSAARAADETAVGTVAGYDITRVNDPGDAFPCRMVRGYADPDDGNAANALAFGQYDAATMIVSLVYEHWTWEAGKTVTSRLSIDGTLIDANTQWLGNATYLAVKLPMSNLPTFNGGKKIVLGFKDGDADFDLTGFKPAFEATLRCNREAAAGHAAASPAKPVEGKTVEGKPVAGKHADAKPTDSGTAAKAPPPAPASPPAGRPAAAPSSGPVPSEERAMAYLFALYDRWAFDACDMRSTGKQRAALEAKAAALKPEMTAVEADFLKQVQGDPSRCPPAAELERQLQLLLDNGPEAFVAKMDERTRKEFQGIVRPILARLKPPAPPAPAPAPAPAAPAASPARKPLPSEARIGAYLMGLTIQDVIQRCDAPTTGRQRTAITAKVEALRPEMTEVEAGVREALRQGPCPEPGDAEAAKEIAAAIALYADKTPEDFVAAWDASKRNDAVMREARKIVEAVRPPGPSEARLATFLWGLVMQDKIAQCDIATTARQRAGLDARVASLKQEMGEYEAALREQVKGQVADCPAPARAAEMLSMLPLFIEAQPEAFAAEMDRRTAARKTAQAPEPAPAKEAPAKAAAAKDTPAKPPSGEARKPASCGETAFPLARADLVAALKTRLKPLGVEDVVEQPRSVANHRRYDLKGADVTVDLDGPEGKVTTFYVRQGDGGPKNGAEVALVSAATIVAAFTRGARDTVEEEMSRRLGPLPVSQGHSEKFDTATVFYTRQEGGAVTMLIDNSDAGDCRP